VATHSNYSGTLQKCVILISSMTCSIGWLFLFLINYSTIVLYVVISHRIIVLISSISSNYSTIVLYVVISHRMIVPISSISY
jgi:hypothetical protein